jgi:hypothetical protein
MSDWQPIETAPRDGTHIAIVTEGGHVLKAHYGDIDDFCAWLASEEDQHPISWDDGVCWAENSDYMPSDPPKWWMPMPEYLK